MGSYQLYSPGLPNDPLFRQLVRNSQEILHTIFKDPYVGVEADYRRFLTDVVHFRDILRRNLPVHLLDEDGFMRNDRFAICILASVGYEFAVALYAIFALGAVAVPLYTGLVPEEVTALMRKCNAISLVTGSEYSDLGRVIQDSGNGVVHWTPIQINPATGSSSAMVTIDGDVTFSPNRPALILFSSGTTGVPKAILHSRQMLWPRDSPLDSADVVLLYFPLHWAGGVVELLGAMSVGACVETFRFKMGSYADIWERLRHGRITAFRGAPFFWNGLKNFFEKNLRLQPQEELQPYIQAVQQLRHVSFSGGMPSPSLKRFWVDLRGGRSFHLGYGSTELGGPGLRIDLSKEDDLSKRSIGTPTSGTEVKVAGGDHGELLIKAPSLFLGYLEEPDRTKAAFDENRFFKTGDLVHFDGARYLIDGRVKADFIRYYAFQISIPELEASIQDLPYVAEAYVLGVPDAETGYRAAALIRPRENTDDQALLALHQLRADLYQTLQAYKLPTLLRLLQPHEPSPLTPHGKPDYKQALAIYFPQSADNRVEDLPPEIEVWEDTTGAAGEQRRAWDGGGLFSLG